MKKTKLHNKQPKNKHTKRKHNKRSSRNIKTHITKIIGGGVSHTKLKFKTGSRHEPLFSHEIDNENETTLPVLADNESISKLHLLSGDINSILFKYGLLKKKRHSYDHRRGVYIYKHDYSLLKNQFLGYKLYYYNENRTEEMTKLDGDLLKKMPFSPLEDQDIFRIERVSTEFKEIINSITNKIKLKIDEIGSLNPTQIKNEIPGIITQMISNGEIRYSIEDIREMCARSVSIRSDSNYNNNIYGDGQRVRISDTKSIEESILIYCIDNAIRQKALDVLKPFFFPSFPTDTQLSGEFVIGAQTIVDLINVKSIYYNSSTKTFSQNIPESQTQNTIQPKEFINGVMMLNFYDQPNTIPIFGVNFDQNIHLSINPTEKVIICIVNNSPENTTINPSLRLKKFLVSVKQKYPTIFNKTKAQSFNVRFLEKPDTSSEDFHLPLVSTYKDVEKYIAVPDSYERSAETERERVRIEEERRQLEEERRRIEEERQRYPPAYDEAMEQMSNDQLRQLFGLPRQNPQSIGEPPSYNNGPPPPVYRADGRSLIRKFLDLFKRNRRT